MDDALQSAIIHTLTGWPNYEKDVSESLKAFFNVRSILSVSNGLLTYVIHHAKMRRFSKIMVACFTAYLDRADSDGNNDNSILLSHIISGDTPI